MIIEEETINLLIKTYSELIKMKSFKERFEYLQIKQFVGDTTFGTLRYLNQKFYHSKQWREFADFIAERDNYCELGIPKMEISGRLIIHHINPITPEFIDDVETVLNPDNAITCSDFIHRAIHYGFYNNTMDMPKERKPGDTCLWR